MAGEIPRYFLLRSGTHYIVAEALLAVHQEALPPRVRDAMSGEIETSSARIEAVVLPSPGDPCDDEDERPWVMLAAMKQTGVMKNPPGGGG